MAVTVRCPNCGAAAPQEAAFCPDCGGKMRTEFPTAPPPPSMGAEPPPHAAPGHATPPPLPPPPERTADYTAPPPLPPPPERTADRISQARTTTNGFFASLFDWGFTTFVTPKLIKIGYIVSAVYLGLVWLLFVLVAFYENGGFGLVVLVFGGLATVLALMMTRLLFEFLMVVFRAAVDVHDTMKRRDVG